MSQEMQQFGEQELDASGLEDQIRRRAYELWEQEGRPEDRSDEFWFRAMQELRGMPESTEPLDLDNAQNVPVRDTSSVTDVDAR